MKERVASDFPHTRADLEELVRIPGCAFPGFPDDEIERACQAVIDIYRAAGFPRVERLDIDGGKPAVMAEVAGPPGSPSVLLYAHYDVHPASAVSLWHRPPIEPPVRDRRPSR